jgi:hypothetical protein
VTDGNDNREKMTQPNGYGILRTVLQQARAENGCSLTDLTALSAQVDPYRLDTPQGHKNGKWLADQLNKALGSTRRVHWRGLHYILVSGKKPARKPDGTIYRNTDDEWLWLSGVAGKAARWLGYIPFDRITDNRNAEPIIHRRVRPEAFVSIGLDVIAQDANEDGRPLVMFTLADCDPAGWQMAVSIARKLQALGDLLSPRLRFEVVPGPEARTSFDTAQGNRKARRPLARGLRNRTDRNRRWPRYVPMSWARCGACL